MTKLTDEDVAGARIRVRSGESIRSVARSLKVSNVALLKRLRKAGGSYNHPSPTLEILQEYAEAKDPKIRAIATAFLKQNTERLLNTQESRVFFRLQSEKSIGGRENYHDFGSIESFIDPKRGRGCKVC